MGHLKTRLTCYFVGEDIIFSLSIQFCGGFSQKHKSLYHVVVIGSRVNGDVARIISIFDINKMAYLSIKRYL